MTEVQFAFRDPASGGVDTLADGWVECSLVVVENAAGITRTIERFPVVLVDGKASVQLSVTGEGQAWRIQVHGVAGVGTFYKQVPASLVALPYTALAEVDPDSLAPVSGGGGAASSSLLLSADWSFAGLLTPRIGVLPWLSPPVPIRPKLFVATLGGTPASPNSGTRFRLVVNGASQRELLLSQGQVTAEIDPGLPLIPARSRVTVDIVTVPTVTGNPASDAVLQLWYTTG